MIYFTLRPVMDFALDGVRVQVYYAREPHQGLPAHAHPYPHHTAVIGGRIELAIEGRKPIVLEAWAQPVILPAELEHSIEAMETGTVFMNLSKDRA